MSGEIFPMPSEPGFDGELRKAPKFKEVRTEVILMADVKRVRADSPMLLVKDPYA
jgi:hypothetical protein